MEKANVLIVGNSGAGKSTLINAMLGAEVSPTALGEAGTQKIELYENDALPFRLIDTKGYEYNFFSQRKTLKQLTKWIKEGVKNKEQEKQIHVIWYCLDGTSKKLFKDNLTPLMEIERHWPHVPIIFVITKSYSQIEIKENIEMIEQALEKHSKNKLNVKNIIPVVAKIYPITQDLIVPVSGIEELITCTNDLIPEGMRLSKSNFTKLDLRIKRNIAYPIIGASTISAAAIGGIPIPFPDTLILIPLQTTMITSIARIYKLDTKSNVGEYLMQQLINQGIVSATAKTLLNALKMNPAINLAADALNAIVASSITAVIGTTAATIMEMMYRGEIATDNFDYIHKFIERAYSKGISKYIDQLQSAIVKGDKEEIGHIVENILRNDQKAKKED